MTRMISGAAVVIGLALQMLTLLAFLAPYAQAYYYKGFYYVRALYPRKQYKHVRWRRVLALP